MLSVWYRGPGCTTTLASMARSFTDLVSWLGRDNSFPDGVILLTGTGIVPPDTFTLARGDEIRIEAERSSVILDGEIFEASRSRPIVLRRTGPVSFLRLFAPAV